MLQISKVKATLLLIVFSLLNLAAFAQKKKLDVDISVNKDEPTWYMQPWAWVVGGAVFLLLLVALLRSGGRSKD